jgi:hypothetical protein
MNNVSSEHWTANFTVGMQLANLIPGKSFKNIRSRQIELKLFAIIESHLKLQWTDAA